MIENGAKTKTNNIVVNHSASLYISFPIELSDWVINLDHNTPIYGIWQQISLMVINGHKYEWEFTHVGLLANVKNNASTAIL
jgi:hypothetical protein